MRKRVIQCVSCLLLVVMGVFHIAPAASLAYVNSKGELILAENLGGFEGTKYVENLASLSYMTIRKHILPRLGAVPIGEIKTADIQVWFDELCQQGYARASIQKIRHIISPAFDSAVEDEIIVKNPLKSKRLKINTDKETHHKAIPEEQMNEMRANLQHLPDRERRFAALLCYTGMRLEEILGLRWEDLDFLKREIHIQRAVIHPKRNKPEIKPPKTKTSFRTIPLAAPLIPVLQPTGEKGFILGGETPLSYQQQKKSFDKIRRTFHLEDYTAHDFRDTCATEWQEAEMPLGTISHLLGHAATTVTEKCYVKFRDAGLLNARRIMEKTPPMWQILWQRKKPKNPYKSRLCGMFLIP